MSDRKGFLRKIAMPNPRKRPRVPAGTIAKMVGRSRCAMLDTTGRLVVDLDEARSDAIRLWTDGSCYPNPGTASIGVVYEDGPFRLELGEYIGESTNNGAELTAVMRALDLVVDPTAPVDVYCDSEYVIGAIALGWNASANRELIAEVRQSYRRLSDVRFVKVAGHTGVPGNERADALAGVARATKKTTLWRND